MYRLSDSPGEQQMTAALGTRAGLPRTTRLWTLGTMAAGLGLVVGFFLYVSALVGWSPAVGFESGLVLYGPYFLCGLTVLFANGARAARIYAVLVLVSGLAMGTAVAWELTAVIVQTGAPPAMLVTVFIGAFVLVGQYLVTGLGFFVAWIDWMVTPWHAAPPPTQEERDYAD
jgi:hypothetical protein